MQIEYEKPGATIVFGYPQSVEDAKKLENYYGGLNLFINLNFDNDFDLNGFEGQYSIDEEGNVLNKTIFEKNKNLLLGKSKELSDVNLSLGILKD